MKELLLLTLISLTCATVIVIPETWCACSDITVENDCLTYYNHYEDCIWVDNKCRAQTCIERTEEKSCGLYPHYTCKWNKTCKDYIVLCSDFTTSRDCDDIPDKFNCVWNNNTCIPFTKCSDYELRYEHDSCRHLTDKPCIINSTGDACKDYTNICTSCSIYSENECKWCQNYPCYFDTSCKKATKCRQIDSFYACGISSGCIYDTHCRNFECSDHSEDSCWQGGSILNEKNLKFLCKWDAEAQKCSEIAKISEFDSEEKCYGNFYWDGTQCNQCASIAARINYTKPDSDPIPDPPKSDQIVTFDFKNFCPCQGYHEQYNCNRESLCKWENNYCRQKKCPEYSESDCKDSSSFCQWDNTCSDIIGGNCGLYISPWECNSHSISQNCVWENDKCVPFTKCSDYIPGIYGCSSKSAKFQACKNNADGTACEDAEKSTVTCNTYLTSDTCIFTYNADCYWDTTCHELTSCTQIKSEFLCLLFKECYYDTSCRNRVCSDYSSRSTCTYVIALGHMADHEMEYSGGTLCQWNPTFGMCVEAIDTSSLTTDRECAYQTFYTYFWDGTKCIQCVDISRESSDLVIRVMICILVFFI